MLIVLHLARWHRDPEMGETLPLSSGRAQKNRGAAQITIRKHGNWEGPTERHKKKTTIGSLKEGVISLN